MYGLGNMASLKVRVDRDESCSEDEDEGQAEPEGAAAAGGRERSRRDLEAGARFLLPSRFLYYFIALAFSNI